MSRTLPAISIRQPWAWLIVNGHKDVENRDWVTHFRGRVLIHAGLTFPRSYYEEQRSAMARAGILPGGFPGYEELQAQCGGIVGQAWIADCRDESASRWYIEGSKAWVLDTRGACPHRFWPMRGRLGFFDVAVDA